MSSIVLQQLTVTRPSAPRRRTNVTSAKVRFSLKATWGVDGVMASYDVMRCDLTC